MNDIRLLAIDTATEVCSVALLDRGRLTVRSEQVGAGHSARALPMVDAVLASAGVALGDLHFVAFGAGPGSFTGLRIACGLAQGLAWGARLRVIGVGNLHALAARVFAAEPAAARVLCAIDARMHEAYCAVYERAATSDDPPVEVLPPQLAPAAELAALAAGCDAIAGDALTAFPQAWPGVRVALRDAGARADAGDIARLAALGALRTRAVAPEHAAPLYVRDRVALTIAERQAAA